MKYISINTYYDGEEFHIWAESAEASNDEEAEDCLARNNPQIILNEEEARKLLSELLGILTPNQERR